MKILVPTDFSDNANNALEFAKKIALMHGASITLLFTFYAIYDFAAQAAEIVDQIEKDAKKAMKEEVKEGEKEGLKVDYKILQGAVSTVITATAFREGYDLIVMGTQGASGMKKALMGSNTGNVIKESKVPVLAVPSNATWKKINKISVSVELAKEEELNYKKLMMLTAPFKVPYEFLHVEKTHAFEKDITLKGLESYLKENYPKQSISFIVKTAEEVTTGIDKYLKKNKGTLLVMFYKNKSFFEYLFNKSQTVEMVYHTHVPLLVLKTNP
ncbi:hypothetical protein P872_15285 [Rhodonellum psychrophilum GCM71 = DSM 17998]|uniref:UspA domain-containing protein n=2 Tax=Rhodonellum TaxID=336827 RepID=U5BU35_9BACT|nr:MULTISPECIES: universal stress protein [Rhodonellum]ERM84145.1 hypothetical protein P872_15285 [Rhodonellum psychrophilum GCM71 = DSM 17998]SDZ20222.1 Nucleotide-binding universal stress protein, UspA family [Rhodonellum ikkaensis]